MLIAQGAIDASKIGVTIALRYACARPQFQGKRIMEYLTHQRRLLPALATTYAMQLQSLRLKVHARISCSASPWTGKFHVLVSQRSCAAIDWPLQGCVAMLGDFFCT